MSHEKVPAFFMNIMLIYIAASEQLHIHTENNRKRDKIDTPTKHNIHGHSLC